MADSTMDGMRRLIGGAMGVAARSAADDDEMTVYGLTIGSWYD